MSVNVLPVGGDSSIKLGEEAPIWKMLALRCRQSLIARGTILNIYFSLKCADLISRILGLLPGQSNVKMP